MCSCQLRVLWIFKPRYLAQLTLFSTCPWIVYLDCSGVLLVVIYRTLHLSGWSCISHWSSHFCNVSRSCCRMRRSSSDLILRYRLIIYGFTSNSRIFHLYGDVTIADGGLQSLWSVLWVFEQEGIFIVPLLLWHRTSVFLCACGRTNCDGLGHPANVATCARMALCPISFKNHFNIH
jgi:hypothetical protein